MCIPWHLSTQSFIYQQSVSYQTSVTAQTLHTDLVQSLWHQCCSRRSPLCDLQCCWCQSAWQQRSAGGRAAAVVQRAGAVQAPCEGWGEHGTAEGSSRAHRQPIIDVPSVNPDFPSPCVIFQWVNVYNTCWLGRAELMEQLLPEPCWTQCCWGLLLACFWSAVDKLNLHLFFKRIQYVKKLIQLQNWNSRGWVSSVVLPAYPASAGPAAVGSVCCQQDCALSPWEGPLLLHPELPSLVLASSSSNGLRSPFWWEGVSWSGEHHGIPVLGVDYGAGSHIILTPTCHVPHTVGMAMVCVMDWCP